MSESQVSSPSVQGVNLEMPSQCAIFCLHSMTGPRAVSKAERAPFRDMFLSKLQRYEGHKCEPGAARSKSSAEASRVQRPKTSLHSATIKRGLFLSLPLGISTLVLCNKSHMHRRDPGKVIYSFNFNLILIFPHRISTCHSMP